MKIDLKKVAVALFAGAFTVGVAFTAMAQENNAGAEATYGTEAFYVRHHSGRSGCGSYGNRGYHHSQDYCAAGTSGSGSCADGAWECEPGDTGRRCYRYSDNTCPSNCWKQIDSNWYYFDESGWAQTGWVSHDGNTYYCDGTGARVTGDWVIDGRSCHFNADGVLQ